MTVPAASQTAGLPVEILSLILTEVATLSLILTEVATLRDIIQCSHVCKCWRTLAHSRSSLFAAISVTNKTNGRHMLQRLAVSSGPLNVTMKNDTQLDTSLLHNMVVHIAANTRRLESLCVFCHDQLSLDIWLRALREPAPILRRLELHLCEDESEAIVLPYGVTIFAGHAPMLTCLSLSSIYLPREQITAFSRVQALCVNVGPGVPKHAFYSLLSSCPSIKTLALSWTDEINFRATSSRQLASVEEIFLHSNPAVTMSVLQALSSTASRAVLAWADNMMFSLCSLLLLQLPRGDLHLEFGDTSINLTITFIHPQSRIRRTLACESGDDWKDEARLIMQKLHMCARITELRVATWRYSLVASVGVFPTLRTLVLFGGLPLEGYDEEEWPEAGRTLLPALQKLVIAYDDDFLPRCSIIDVGKVISLMGTLRVVAHIELELQGVSLSGDVNRLWGHFSRIVSVPLPPSPPPEPFPDFY